MNLVECDLDYSMECLAVFFGCSLFTVTTRSIKIRGSGSWLDEDGEKRKRLWIRKADRLSRYSLLDAYLQKPTPKAKRHHPPSYQRSLTFNQREWKITTKIDQKAIYCNDPHYFVECIYDLLEKIGIKDNKVLALIGISWGNIWYFRWQSLFTNWTSQTACFIQLFVFTCSRCGSHSKNISL